MPLSDHEKRMLQEMEAALLTEDPRLFSALSGEVKPVGRKKLLLGLGLVLLGLITLFGGLVAKITPVGVLGFIFALIGVIVTLSSFSSISSLTSRPSGAKSARARRGLGSKLERRWDERNNQ
ncbi:MAG: DUF3040 domain-containing protein [Actinobacteria bacterium]|uniref:Unannotated protein n=1 Tax=freshwater metagenome TaxID=449393 RepID=A0A6J7E8S9_9ZZZZ|nr:DUF3040 domain-containing protein [Actinomycetota bacterium]